jgi:hypothetical protein
MGLLFYQEPDPPRPQRSRRRRSVLFGHLEEEHREKPKVECADKAFLRVFAELQSLWSQQRRSRSRYLCHSERCSWEELMSVVLKLAPPRD